MGSTKEMEVVLALLRVSLGTGGIEELHEAAEGVKWEEVERLIGHHRIAPFLRQRLPPDCRAHLPRVVGLRLQTAANTAAARGLNRAGELVKLAKKLSDAGIRAISVKGPLLGLDLYGDVGLRSGGDLDILIDPADAERADRLLASAGYVRTRPDFDLTPRQASTYLDVQFEYEYVAPKTGIRVELLWRLEGTGPGEQLWESAIPRPMGGITILTLPHNANARYLFQHGGRHAWFRLFWLIDVALLMRRPGTQWAEVVGEARRQGAERPLLQGAMLASRLLGVEPPAELSPAPHERSQIEALAAESWRAIELGNSGHQGVLEWARGLAYRVRLQRFWRAKLAVMKPHFFSLGTWRELPLPDRWFWLYPFATPVLWARRRILPRPPDNEDPQP